jgi:hypothetical protein
MVATYVCAHYSVSTALEREMSMSCTVIYRVDGFGIPYLSRKAAFLVPRLG